MHFYQTLNKRIRSASTPCRNEKFICFWTINRIQFHCMQLSIYQCNVETFTYLSSHSCLVLKWQRTNWVERKDQPSWEAGRCPENFSPTYQRRTYYIYKRIIMAVILVVLYQFSTMENHGFIWSDQWHSSSSHPTNENKLLNNYITLQANIEMRLINFKHILKNLKSMKQSKYVQ